MKKEAYKPLEVKIDGFVYRIVLPFESRVRLADCVYNLSKTNYARKLEKKDREFLIWLTNNEIDCQFRRKKRCREIFVRSGKDYNSAIGQLERMFGEKLR